MVLMLPIAADNGARLAAIMPTGLAALARGLGAPPSEVLASASGGDPAELARIDLHDVSLLPAIRAFVVIVVDGLGHANLQARTAHARTLSALPSRRIETVIPSTTGAALTSVTTGRLPGAHGLIGYRIRHPRLGVVSTLKDWAGITEPAEWQRAQPLFGLATSIGARAVAIGRPAHATGGLTEAILTGAEYHGAVTIADRFAIASRLLRSGEPMLAYLYVDELDKVAHAEGWQSDLWLRRLEQLDGALQDLLRTLPGDVGVVVTADHGMLDIPPARRIELDPAGDLLRGVAEVGGEPRFRSMYLEANTDAAEVIHRLQAALGKRAWVGGRSEAIAANWFGETSSEVAERLGEVLVVARGQYSVTMSDDSPAALAMIGQHGGISEEERGVPLCLGGALAGSGFGAVLARVAGSCGSPDPASDRI